MNINHLLGKTKACPCECDPMCTLNEPYLHLGESAVFPYSQRSKGKPETFSAAYFPFVSSQATKCWGTNLLKKTLVQFLAYVTRVQALTFAFQLDHLLVVQVTQHL